MTDRPSISRYLLGPWFRLDFWKGVESEIGALDAADFEEFARADELPIEPSPEFVEHLRHQLSMFVRNRRS